MQEDTDDSKIESLQLDQLLVSLSRSRRRSILFALAEDNPHDTDEFTFPDFNTEDEDFELFAAEVTYDHLPQLDRAGLIEWDQDSDTITRGPNFEDVRPLITLIHDHRDELPDDWLEPNS